MKDSEENVTGSWKTETSFYVVAEKCGNTVPCSDVENRKAA